MLTPYIRMKLQYERKDDIIFFDKALGLSVADCSNALSQELGCAIFPVLGLDLDMTGVTCFATTRTTADRLNRETQEQRARKKYFFVTAAHSLEAEIHESSEASIHFRRIKRSPFFELWEAETSTAQPEQLRRQARHAQIEILGDSKNGGAPFPLLCLHLGEVGFEDSQSRFSCPSPRYFERLGLLRDPELVKVLAEFDFRQRCYHFLNHREQCLRLHHPDFRSQNQKMKWDLLGPILWGYWYEEEDPTPLDFRRFDFLASLLSRSFRVRKMLNRGQDPHSKIDWTLEETLGTASHNTAEEGHRQTPLRWQAKENEIHYLFCADRGLSPGLFLDQRSNREYIKAHSQGKKVLNLFAYTCGFSVCAAVGGAAEVTSVDVSREFLEWGKENFSLNHLDVNAQLSSGQNQFEFFKQDSFLFLKACQKRQRLFDVIICDPPSFSRSKADVFSLEKDFAELLELCAACLAPQGLLLFSCNFEKWSLAELKARAQKNKKLKLDLDLERSLTQDLDFEKPHQARLLKSLYLRKS